jgi:hypothetical protein
MTDEFARREIEAVARKLNDFAATLPESEQQALAWLIANASSGDEVSGYIAPQSQGVRPIVQAPGQIQGPRGGAPQGIIAILIG